MWDPGIMRVDEVTADGRRGTGTRNHCVHGRDVVLEDILDWRPFDYYTTEVKPPMPLLKPIRMTFELEDIPEGTRVTQSMSHAPGFGQRVAFRMMMRTLAGKFTESQESLRSMLATATATGPASMERGDGG
jgi:hypothetical protein